MEILEKRLAPAGIITAILSGGVLKLIGDANENSLIIDETSPDNLHVSGGDGTLISFNGVTAASFDFTAGKGLTIDLKQGADRLDIGTLSLTGNLNVQLGSGDNICIFNNVGISNGVQIGGDFTLKGQNDADAFQAIDLSVAGATSINLGHGNNDVTLNAAASRFGKGLSYTGGDDLDTFNVNASDQFSVGGSLTLNLGRGTAEVSLSAPVITIGGSLNYTSLENPDHAYFIFSSDLATISGSVTLRSGPGSNVIAFGDVGFLKIGGSLTIVNGDNLNHEITGPTETYINAESVVIGGNFSITNGQGLYSTSFNTDRSVPNFFQGNLTVGGNFSIKHGGNTGGIVSTDSLVFNQLEVGGSLTINAKIGFYQHEIQAGHLRAGGGIAITHQGSVDPAGSATPTVTYLGVKELITPAISISNGSGLFETTLFTQQGLIGKDISIRNGDSDPGNYTRTRIGGIFDVGGGISITNGRGRFETAVECDTLRVGESIRIIHGDNLTGLASYITVGGTFLDIADDLVIRNGKGAFENTVVATNLQLGNDLTIQQGDNLSTLLEVTSPVSRITLGNAHISGDLTIVNGRGEYTHNFSVGTLTIDGRLSISNGRHFDGSNGYNATVISGTNVTVDGQVRLTNSSGNTNTDFQGENFDLRADVIVSNGAGEDNFTSTLSSLHIGGSLILNSGAGLAFNTILSISTFNLSIGGNLTARSQDGGTLNVFSSGLIKGAVTVEFGSGIAEVDLVGAASPDNHGLIIGGPLSLTTSAASQRTLGLHGVTLNSSLRLGGSETTDSVVIEGSHLHGGLHLNLRGGTDSIRLQNSTFQGAVTLLTGDGADSIEIATSIGNFQPVTQFDSTVVINMGADDDVLSLGTGYNSTDDLSLLAFYSKVTLDGGAGVNTLNATITAFPADRDPHFMAGLPTILNFDIQPPLGGV